MVSDTKIYLGLVIDFRFWLWFIYKKIIRIQYRFIELIFVCKNIVPIRLKFLLWFVAVLWYLLGKHACSHPVDGCCRRLPTGAPPIDGFLIFPIMVLAGSRLLLPLNRMYEENDEHEIIPLLLLALFGVGR